MMEMSVERSGIANNFPIDLQVQIWSSDQSLVVTFTMWKPHGYKII